MTFFEITLISCLKILKNMYVRRRQGEITLLWCLKNTNNLWYLLKSQYDSENVEKNMYLRRCQGIITLLNPKNADNLWYFVEITLLWFPKILREKKNVCRMLPKQNHTKIQINKTFLSKSPYYDPQVYYKIIKNKKSKFSSKKGGGKNGAKKGV